MAELFKIRIYYTLTMNTEDRAYEYTRNFKLPLKHQVSHM